MTTETATYEVGDRVEIETRYYDKGAVCAYGVGSQEGALTLCRHRQLGIVVERAMGSPSLGFPHEMMLTVNLDSPDDHQHWIRERGYPPVTRRVAEASWTVRKIDAL